MESPLMFPRFTVLALAMALGACASTGTEPTIPDAKSITTEKAVTPPTSHRRAIASARFFDEGQWVVNVERWTTKGARPDSTILDVTHCSEDCEAPVPQEITTVFHGPIPDKDFKVGGLHRDWELQTTIEGNGTIDLLWHNQGQEASRSQTPVEQSGTVFGMDASGPFGALFFDKKP
jgi:hypothetical protein